METNLRSLERIQDQISTNQENLREAENRKLLIQQQLAEAKKVPEILAPLPARAGQEPEQSLEQLKTLLASLEARYTERHPDVVRLKQKISDLESRQKPEATERRRSEWILSTTSL